MIEHARRDRAARHRILLVAPNWLGDVVMATPLLDALAAGDAAPAITVAVRRRWAPLLAGDPRVADLILYDRHGRHAGVSGGLRLAAVWRRERFDAAVLTPPSLRAALVARAAGIPLRFGYRTDRRGWLLSHGLRPPRRGRWHHSEELWALGPAARAALAGAAASDPDPRSAPLPSLPALDRVAAAAMGEGPPCWLVGIGATYGEAKAWPADRVAELLRLTVGEQGYRAVLIGTAEAAARALSLRERTRDLPWRPALPGRAAVVDLTGGTDLRALVALIRAAAGYVGNDSGPMHLAAALGRPTVGVFGSSNPDWTGPRGRRAAAVTARGFPCHPCYLKRCPEERFCLATVSAARVARRLLALMESDGADAPLAREAGP